MQDIQPYDEDYDYDYGDGDAFRIDYERNPKTVSNGGNNGGNEGGGEAVDRRNDDARRGEAK